MGLKRLYTFTKQIEILGKRDGIYDGKTQGVLCTEGQTTCGLHWNVEIIVLYILKYGIWNMIYNI